MSSCHIICHASHQGVCYKGGFCHAYYSRFIVSHDVFSYVWSICLPQRTHIYSDCICLVFLHCVSSNVSSICLSRKTQSHIGCIYSTFLHRAFAYSLLRPIACDEAKLHWLHLWDFFPPCILICIPGNPGLMQTSHPQLVSHEVLWLKWFSKNQYQHHWSSSLHEEWATHWAVCTVVSEAVDNNNSLQQVEVLRHASFIICIITIINIIIIMTIMTIIIHPQLSLDCPNLIYTPAKLTSKLFGLTKLWDDHLAVDQLTIDFFIQTCQLILSSTLHLCHSGKAAKLLGAGCWHKK